jgi:hypothetical protein
LDVDRASCLVAALRGPVEARFDNERGHTVEPLLSQSTIVWRSMRPRFLLLFGPGLVVGAMLCVIALITGNLQSGDSTMAKYEVLGMASVPLSSVLGSTADYAKERIANGALWGVIDYGQVLLNWMLLPLVVVGSVMLLRRGRS